MFIKTETRTVNIELRIWRSCCGYDPDCFQDIECNFPLRFPDQDEDFNILAPDAEVDDLITWWEDECEAANNGNGEVLDTPKEDETWHLIVEEK